MLMSKNNRSYGKNFVGLEIQDDPRKPHAHIWPMRIPGYFLPKLMYLELINFDWTATRPHDLFFHFLSYYTSIKTLAIGRCQFRSIAELRRISTALPSLETLSLAEITLQHQLVPGLVSRYVPNLSRNKLKKMVIGSLHDVYNWHLDSVAPAIDTHIPSVYHQFLWDVCVTYSYVTELELDLRYYSSLSSLHRFLHHFPHLSRLLLHDSEHGSHVEPASAADLALYTAHALNPSLSDLRFKYVPVSLARQILLVLSPQACSRLEALRVFFLCWHCQLHDRQRAEFVLRVTEVLCLAGAGLKKFQWEHNPVDGDLIHDDVPRLTANTSLTNLTITLCVDPSLPSIQRALDTLLSDIRSPHLERLTVMINLIRTQHDDTSEDRDKTSVSEADPPGSTSTFHAILSRSIFDQLPAVSEPYHESAGVFIAVRWAYYGSPVSEPQEEAARTTALSAIKSNMITLFAPWLDRGVMQLSFNLDPDGEMDVTRDSSSVLRVLGTPTHASIKEIADSEPDDGHEDHARDASGDMETEDPIPPQ
ncbi:uncharacterized protein B0H18DRAFT_1026144 [Fomitopsis serialis]|uniref:uncharacterized protein n=1 Tax=Fomitopsis serialis TaxID=139415 RepID=UPI002007D189|nr:uncharacterized protein B0H18DRAFT_1026144 [Neoantrodia serialis]KAH9919917.1 hypothetical protein B0H18DRAFT_1026144 [Neoantrodia serialis]